MEIGNWIVALLHFKERSLKKVGLVGNPGRRSSLIKQQIALTARRQDAEHQPLFGCQ